MNQHITVQPLVYNGEIIAQRDEMLSLTDMWRAAGSPEEKRPNDWAMRSGKDFVEFVAITHNAAVGGILKTARGKGGGTLGHWQIGLAYAKYLSPDFHMWCNTVVRERMEGRSVAVANLPPDVLEMIRRDDGISRMLSHKITVMEKTMMQLLSLVTSPHPGPRRSGKTAGELWQSLKLPRLKNAPTWFGNKLEKMGCRIDGKGELGLTKARLFDPDKADVWLQNGGMHIVKQKVAERQGQGKLRLVGEA